MVPASFATGGHVAVYFEAAAVIVSPTLLGQRLEGRARSRTAAALRSLLGLAPKTARVIAADGSERDLALADVRPGDRLRARPGEKVLPCCRAAVLPAATGCSVQHDQPALVLRRIDRAGRQRGAIDATDAPDDRDRLAAGALDQTRADRHLACAAAARAVRQRRDDTHGAA